MGNHSSSSTGKRTLTTIVTHYIAVVFTIDKYTHYEHEEHLFRVHNWFRSDKTIADHPIELDCALVHVLCAF